MKNKFIAAAILLSGIATNANSQTTTYAETRAELVEPIAINKTFDMHFGTLASSGTPGTVVLDYANGRTQSGGVRLITGAAPKTAEFAVTGQAGSSISIAIPQALITLTGSVAGSVTVSDFFCDQLTTTNLDVNGAATLKVKATLNVPANTVAGIYSNTLGNASALFVTVNYN